MHVGAEQVRAWDNSRTSKGKDLGKQTLLVINTTVLYCRCNIHHSIGREETLVLRTSKGKEVVKRLLFLLKDVCVIDHNKQH